MAKVPVCSKKGELRQAENPFVNGEGEKSADQ